MNLPLKMVKKVTMPPSGAYDSVVVYDKDETDEALIQFDLWIDSEKSDLTMTYRIHEIGSECPFIIENLRVL